MERPGWAMESLTLPRSVGVLLFLFCLSIFFLTAHGNVNGDEVGTFLTAKSVVERGRLSLDPRSIPEFTSYREHAFRLGRDGEYHAPTGLLWAVVLVPFVVVGKLVALPFSGAKAMQIMSFVTSFEGAVFSALAVLALASLTRRFGGSVKASVGLALLYAFGTSTWYYAKGGHADPLNVFLLLLAFGAAHRYGSGLSRASLGWSGVLLGLAILTKIYNVIVLPLFLLYVGWLRRRAGQPFWPKGQEFFLLFGPPLAGVALVLGYNSWLFGAGDVGYGQFWMLPWGYGESALSRILNGRRSVFFLAMYLVSPGQSVLLYNLPIVLGLLGFRRFWRTFPVESRFILLFTATYLAFFCLYSVDGKGWGPRYLLPVAAFFLLPAGPVLDGIFRLRRPIKLAVVFVGVLMVLLQLSSVIAPVGRFLHSLRKVGINAPEYAFRVDLTPMVLASRQAARMIAVPSGIRPVTALHPLIPLVEFDRVPATWFFKLLYFYRFGTYQNPALKLEATVHVGPGLLVAASGLLTALGGLAVVSGWGLLRALRATGGDGAIDGRLRGADTR